VAAAVAKQNSHTTSSALFFTTGRLHCVSSQEKKKHKGLEKEAVKKMARDVEK
jgi:hypothetical protein